MEDTIQEIDIHSIVENPSQPRKNFLLQELEELAASIEEIGLIHAPVVRELGSEKFELVAGERRLRAMKLLGWSKIPVVIKKMSAPVSAHAALIENIQRIDLNAMEVADALFELMEQSNLTQELLADKVGKKRSTVANFLRLLQLPEPVKRDLRCDKLTMGHAKAILSLPRHRQEEFAHQIIEGELSVRQAEQLAKGMLIQKEKPIAKEKVFDVHLSEIKNLLEQRLGTKVEIKQDKIEIDYYGWSDLDRLLEILGIGSCCN